MARDLDQALARTVKTYSVGNESKQKSEEVTANANNSVNSSKLDKQQGIIREKRWVSFVSD